MRIDSRAATRRRSFRIAGVRVVGLALVLAATAARADEPARADATAASATATTTPTATATETKAAAAPTAKLYTLAEVLDLSDRNHPNILAARARLDFVRAQLDEAHTAPFSQVKLTGGVGVAPSIRGGASYSPDHDTSLSTDAGVGFGWRVNLEGVLPLWTFGKIGNLWDAAEANVKVNEAGVEKERDLVRLEVRRAYYGLQLARDAKRLLADVKKQLDSAEKALDEKVKKDEADPIDLLKLQTFATELDVRAAEADRYVDVALAGLRFYTGTPTLDIPDTPLAAPRHELLPVERYLEAAAKYRPELAQARYGLAAREAQVRMAESGFYPDVGIGLTVGVGVAPEIDDQRNPFVTDPGNIFRYGAALVFQWNLDIAPQVARLHEAESQLAEMHATGKLATGGVEAEVRVAYAEVQDWKRRTDAYAKSNQYAKKWLIRVQQGIDVGTIEDKELLEPAKTFALGRFNLMNATMELDIAMAKLARATGWAAIAPDGVAP
jgi:outer membrane protein TolC